MRLIRTGMGITMSGITQRILPFRPFGGFKERLLHDGRGQGTFWTLVLRTGLVKFDDGAVQG